MRWSYELHTGSATWAHRTGCSAGGLLVGWAMTMTMTIELGILILLSFIVAVVAFLGGWPFDG